MSNAIFDNNYELELTQKWPRNDPSMIQTDVKQWQAMEHWN